MSVLIKGLKLPKKGTCIVEMSIFDDGTVEYYDDEKKIGEGKAIELPDHHGNLIDRTPFLDEKFIRIKDDKGIERYMIDAFDLLKAPVIIPAERSEE